VPELPVTHNEPFHAATGTATLDYVARARGAWSPVVQTTEEQARLVGRRSAAPAAEAWREAEHIDDVVSRLWTSWDRDAEIRDQATARFLDRDRVHYVDFTGTDSVGQEFTVKGPSIVPRPPQGELPTVVTVDGPESAAAAVHVADVAILTGTAAEAGVTSDSLRAAAAEAGRTLIVLSDVPQLSTPDDALALAAQSVEAPVAGTQSAGVGVS
jgi:alkanesulfonate monooxygenase SsuD/methylene tetrahydromethanopterin reductase-like flavin-dependent oxidoreductase (luciferase family)